MTRYLLLSFLVALLIFSFSAGEAKAYMDIKDLPKLDMKVKMTKEDYLRTSDLVEETVEGDTTLSYRLRVPKGWIKMPVASIDELQFTAEIFKTVVTYLSPPMLDQRSTFRVRALELKKFISAENWLLNYVLREGAAIQGFNFRSSRRVEAQYTFVSNGDSYVVRAIAELTGSKIVLAEYLVPSDYWEEQKDLQTWTMMSFQLTQPEIGPVEKVDTYAFVDIVKFLYPKSWILVAPPILSIDRMEATLLNVSGIAKEDIGGKDIDIRDSRLDGRMDINVVSKSIGTTELAEIDNLREKLRKMGMAIGDIITTVDPGTLHEGVIQSKVDAYKIKSDDRFLIGYEIWVALLETKGRYYLISLLTPGRQEDFYLWAQNTATFKYIIGTISPVNEGEK